MVREGLKYSIELEGKIYNCPVEVTLSLIDGKWKGIVIWYLKDKTLRFNELQKLISNISQKMLTRELRDLEKNGLLIRKVYAEVPPKVEYSLSEYGKTLIPIIESVSDWGIQHTYKFGKVINHGKV